MDRCALFVDAGYVLADGAMAVHGTRHKEVISWDFAGLLQLLSDLATERSGLPLLRCYWYDAALEGRRTPDHDTLAELPGLKLRLGRMRPGRREGADAEIHRDLSTLARNHAIADAVLVSADEDLAHVIADVQDLGVRVTLVYVVVDGGWPVSALLRQECDAVIEVDAAQLRPYAKLISSAEPAAFLEQRATARSPEAVPANGRALVSGHGAHEAPPAGRHGSPSPYPPSAKPVEYAFERAGQGDAPGQPSPEASGAAGEPPEAGKAHESPQVPVGQPSPVTGTFESAEPGAMSESSSAAAPLAAAAQPRATVQPGAAAAVPPGGAAPPGGTPGTAAPAGSGTPGTAARPGAAAAPATAAAQSVIVAPADSGNERQVSEPAAASAPDAATRPAQVGQPATIGQPALPGQSAPAAYPAQVGQPATMGQPAPPEQSAPAARPAQVDQPTAMGQPVPLGQPAPASQPVPLEQSAAMGQAVPLGQPAPASQPVPLEQSAAAGQPVPLGRPGPMGQPVPLGQPAPGQSSAAGQPALMGQFSALGHRVAAAQGAPSGQLARHELAARTASTAAAPAPSAGVPPPHEVSQRGMTPVQDVPQRGMPPVPDTPQRGMPPLHDVPHWAVPQEAPQVAVPQGRALPEGRAVPQDRPVQPQLYAAPTPPSPAGGRPRAPESPAAAAPYATPQRPYSGPQPGEVSAVAVPASTTTLADATAAAHAEGLEFGGSVAREAPALWLEAVLARKPRMPSDLEARLFQGSSLPIDFLLHDEVRQALRRGFWDALERARR